MIPATTLAGSKALAGAVIMFGYSTWGMMGLSRVCVESEHAEARPPRPLILMRVPIGPNHDESREKCNSSYFDCSCEFRFLPTGESLFVIYRTKNTVI